MKGETPEEIAAFAKVMRAHAVRVNPRVTGTLVDTCGTGGDGAQTVNISTAAAFVAAGAGCPHRQARQPGREQPAADLPMCSPRFGVAVSTVPAEKLANIVESVGMVFLFAPNHHPATRHVMAARQELGCRTVFNLLGPLANPAGAGAQVLGSMIKTSPGRWQKSCACSGVSRALVVYWERA